MKTPPEVQSHLGLTLADGLPAGAARAFVPDLPVYLDEKLMEQQWLVGGSGRFDYSIRYYAQDLVLLAGSRVVDIAD